MDVWQGFAVDGVVWGRRRVFLPDEGGAFCCGQQHLIVAAPLGDAVDASLEGGSLGSRLGACENLYVVRVDQVSNGLGKVMPNVQDEDYVQQGGK